MSDTKDASLSPQDPQKSLRKTKNKERLKQALRNNLKRRKQAATAQRSSKKEA